jgi:hypothetical protein
MARSYGEFVASRPPGSDRPLRRRVLSDEEMAELETNALAAKAAKSSVNVPAPRPSSCRA